MSTKGSEHIRTGFSFFTISSMKNIEHNHDVYRSKDCMEIFCESLTEDARKIIDFEKKKMKLLNEQQKSYENAHICYI